LPENFSIHLETAGATSIPVDFCVKVFMTIVILI